MTNLRRWRMDFNRRGYMGDGGSYLHPVSGEPTLVK
jgi:hypothetical protein